MNAQTNNKDHKEIESMPVNEKEIFSSALLADKPSPELEENAYLYDWLIGSWDISAIDYLDDQEIIRIEGEWHFSRILEGRAVQDVYIVPRRNLRNPFTSKTRNRYGSTIRYYDAAIEALRLTVINPVSGACDQLIAKKVGKDIVQEGKDAFGNLMRWSFIDIK